jgi:glycosyltransferase involved in cell wall biosynthesis
MNTPLVSIIVPTFNSARYLDGCLNSVCKQNYPNIELIVVDNNSRDETKQIAKKYTSHVCNRGPERSAQRNFGVQQSHGSLLLIIDSDMELAENVVRECVAEHLKSGFSAIVIPEESFGQGFWAQCKTLERSFYLGIDWMEAARFFSRDVFDEMGGYNENNTGTEDYDLPQRIEHKYGRRSIGRVSEFIYHNEQRIGLFKSCNKKYYYAQKLSVYQAQEANRNHFRRQSSLMRRYALFLSHPLKLFRNPLIGGGMLFMKTCELFAAGLGYLKGKYFPGLKAAKSHYHL